MTIRKCVYTGRKASLREKVLPQNKFEENTEYFNWCNTVPICQEYQDFKGNDMPTELEMQANEYFRMLELYRLRVKYYELKLLEIQEKIRKEANLKETIDTSKDEPKVIDGSLEDISKKIDDLLDQAKRNPKLNKWKNK
ncbi:MAG: hypothetical protein PHF86_10245 [Candidatus Nanoarchaeia archaeon]|nr:hypothetical protein [Candidatus Nanoarchaeia archaeon]